MNRTQKEDYRWIVWNYFKLHANQRIVLFRFYIIFFSLFSIVIGHLVSEFHFVPIYHELIVITLSLVFIFITIIFWFLDNRNRYLIHNAEEYFVEYEQKFEIDDAAMHDRFSKTLCVATVFTREKNDNGFLLRHTICFKMIYSLAILLSFVFIGFSVFSMCHHDNNTYYQIKFVNTEVKQ